MGRIKDLFKSDFAGHLTTQLLGTGIAQVLPVLIVPLLSRIYDQDDFALYTSFFATATILSAAIGGKYHLAIILPTENEDARKLASLSYHITFFYSLFILLITTVLVVIPTMNLSWQWMFLGAYIFFNGFYQTTIQSSIRIRAFKSNAKGKVIQATTYALTSLALGLVGFTNFGLIAGKSISNYGSFAFLYRKSGPKWSKDTFMELKGIALQYINFPKYGIHPSLLNTFSTQGLALALTYFYSKEELGYFGLTYMVLAAPMSLIGVSYRDVFVEKIATHIKEEKWKSARNFFLNSTLLLAAIGTPIVLVMWLFGPFLFAFVFGEDWSISGEYASQLALAYMVKLVVSPLSSIFNATNKLNIASYWQIIYFTTTALVLLGGVLCFKFSVADLFYIYVIHELLLYALYYVLEWRTIKQLQNG